MQDDELVRRIYRQLADHTTRQRVLSLKIVEQARSLVPLLKDHGQHNSAAGLEVLLFEFDALNEQVGSVIKDHPEEFVAALLTGLKK